MFLLKRTENIKFIYNSILFFLFIFTSIILSYFLSYSYYGFDFTDEGFFSVLNANPAKYTTKIHDYAFLYYPIFSVLKGDIGKLRIFNVVFSFFLSFCLVFFLLKNIIADTLKLWPRLILASSFATSSLILFWFMTPTYATLLFQALSLVSIGILLVDSKHNTSAICGWILMSFGGWITFMAKPTSAFVLFFCVLFYFFFSKKINLKAIFLSFCGSLLLFFVSIYAIDGSIFAYVSRLNQSFKIYKILQFHNIWNSFRLDNLSLNHIEKGIIFFGSFLVCCEAFLFFSRKKQFILFGLILKIIFLSAISYLIIFNHDIYYYLGPHRNVITSLILISFIILTGFFYFNNGFSGNLNLPLFCFFLILPYVYAFGSGTNYWHGQGIASFFWVIAGLSLLAPLVSRTELLYPLAIMTQGIVAILVFAYIRTPWGQPPFLWENNTPVAIGTPSSTLLFSESWAEFLNEAIDKSRKSGFKEEDPMIDLTGNAPGLLYALSATNVGHIWNLGGLSGSLRFVQEGLKLASCHQLAGAWILDEPLGPTKIPDEALSVFGADINKDYVEVASWETPKWYFARKERYLQRLLRPIRPLHEAIKTCEEARHS